MVKCFAKKESEQLTLFLILELDKLHPIFEGVSKKFTQKILL